MAMLANLNLIANHRAGLDLRKSSDSSRHPNHRSRPNRHAFPDLNISRQ
jgi:hypothetical protein